MTMTVNTEPSTSPKPAAANATVRTVTPEMASTWLSANSHNRKLRKILVAAYARDMSEGRWTLNGEAIQISVTGVLLNGQHRLAALVEAGVTIPLVVVTNLPDEAQDTIDTGAKRSVGDILKLAGYTDGATMAAIATLSLHITYGRHHRPTDAEKQQIVVNDGVLRWVVTNVLPTLPTRLATKAVLGYAYRVMHEIDPDDCAVFFSKLDTLENLPTGSPILALERRLTQVDRTGAGSFNKRCYVLSLIFMAWNAYRRGESRARIVAQPMRDGSYQLPKPV